MKLGNNKQNYWESKCETEILNFSETRSAELIVLARSKMRPRTFLRKKTGFIGFSVLMSENRLLAMVFLVLLVFQPLVILYNL